MTIHEGLRTISDNIDAVLSVTARLECTHGTGGSHALASFLESRLCIDKLTYVMVNDKNVTQKLDHVTEYDRKAMLEMAEPKSVFERSKWLFNIIGSIYDSLDELAMTNQFQEMLEEDEEKSTEEDKFPLGYLLLLNARTRLQMAKSWMDADLFEHYNKS